MSEGPVQPLEAATVILARPAPSPDSSWQCFMVRRHLRSEFAADVYVFPGGKVDESDRQAATWLPLADSDLVADDAEFRVAAIRELFEEAGVLLAYRDGGQVLGFHGAEEVVRFASYRQSLQENRDSLTDIARRENLTLALDTLHPLSRWITPEGLPRRFDTHFLVARMPEGQSPLHDETETVDSIWISCQEALDRYEAGSFPLVFATEKHLQRLSGFDSIDALIDATREADLQPVTPRMVEHDGETRFLIPGDEGY